MYLSLDLRIDLDHHAADGHTGGIHLDGALAHLEFDGLHGFYLDLAHVHLDGLVAHFDLSGLVPHVQGSALVALLEFDGLIPLLYGDCLIVGDGLSFIVLDQGDAVVDHLAVFVVLHQGLEIFFRLYADEFASLLVFERHHVEIVRPAMQAATGLDAADRLLIGQRPRRHHVGVVHAAHDNGLIDIAFQKIHNHFLADARDVDRAPLRACPEGGDTHPAG